MNPFGPPRAASAGHGDAEAHPQNDLTPPSGRSCLGLSPRPRKVRLCLGLGGSHTPAPRGRARPWYPPPAARPGAGRRRLAPRRGFSWPSRDLSPTCGPGRSQTTHAPGLMTGAGRDRSVGSAADRGGVPGEGTPQREWSGRRTGGFLRPGSLSLSDLSARETMATTSGRAPRDDTLSLVKRKRPREAGQTTGP